MQVGNLVRITRAGFETMVGLVREVHKEDQTVTVEWLPEAKPLIPMIERVGTDSVEVIDEIG